MLCSYGCNKEAKYQLGNGKWCCEAKYQQCPEMKVKFLRSREKVPCPKCGKPISKNTLNTHLSVCQTGTCKKCGKVINGNKKFCDHSCAASYNNINVNRHTKRKTIKHNKNIIDIKITINKKTNLCENCLVVIPPNRKFCSLKCQAEKRKKVQWEQIKNNEGVCSCRTIKARFLENFGYKCWICGTEEWCGRPVPLVLDHINGDPYDNRFENFRLVCGNCDMQLPTYKAKNTGNGRHERRKRYKQGKSY